MSARGRIYRGPPTELFYELEPMLEWWEISKALAPWKGMIGDFECSLSIARRPVNIETHVEGTDSSPPQGPAKVEIPDVALLRAVTTRHFDSVDAARSALEPHLDAWLAFLDLTLECPLRFDFLGAFDSNGNPLELIGKVGTIRIVGTIEEIPPPPEWLDRVPQLAMALRTQWQASRLGRALPLDRAYWCWTLLRATYGGDIASRLNISNAVIDRLRRLTSTGDQAHGRKVGGQGQQTVTADDLAWLNRLMPRLIMRAAEIESGLTELPKVTVSDL